jgi:hypothetical protein
MFGQKTESPQQQQRREDAEAEAQRAAKLHEARRPGREMEAAMREIASDESTGDIESYRRYIRLRATGGEDKKLRLAAALAMKNLKISGDAFNFDLAQYQRHLEYEKQLKNYDKQRVATDSALEACSLEKETAAAALQQAIINQSNASWVVRNLASLWVNADVLKKRNHRLFGDLPDRAELLSNYGALGWPV